MRQKEEVYKFSLRIPEDIKEEFLATTGSTRLSINQWIVQAIEEKMQRDRIKAS